MNDKGQLANVMENTGRNIDRLNNINYAINKDKDWSSFRKPKKIIFGWQQAKSASIISHRNQNTVSNYLKVLRN